MRFFSLLTKHNLRTLHWQGRTETLAFLVALFFALTANFPFWTAALAGYEVHAWRSWGVAAAMLIILFSVHSLLLLLVLTRWSAKPLLAVLFIATACAVYFMQTFRVYLNPEMLRNALRTDVHEASELLSWAMLPTLVAYVLLPLFFLSRFHIQKVSWRSACLRRLGAIMLTLLLGGVALWAAFQDIASLMRNHKDMRYLITPANYLYSLWRVASSDVQSTQHTLKKVGEDAHIPRTQAQQKPIVLIVVVGETARAANWGLSGYQRQTTPQLANLDVVNFPKVSACGTNTEVSLPCMFSAIGRRDYDEARIRGSESLLHVLQRAGVKVLWRDNQSGCKGVCRGLPEEKLADAKIPGLCEGERCLDEVLLHELDKRLTTQNQTSSGKPHQPPPHQLIVLHQLGNHGPAYYKRYPPAYRHFLPACENQDLARCSPSEIVNAYDNALLYTDAVLSKTIRLLKAQRAHFDTAMIYVSDHGESLGENQLFLHGMPYAIAPKVQTEVPMVMWLSPDLIARTGLQMNCLQQRSQMPTAHDHLFHSILGLFNVQSQVYEPAYDVFAGCRRNLVQEKKGG